MRTCSSLETFSCGRRSRDGGADFLGDDLLDDRGRLAEALLLDARPDLVAVLRLEPLGRRRVEPLRLARLRAQLLLGVAELDDLALRDLERLEELVLGHLVRARLDHRQAVLRADDDQVEVGRPRSPASVGLTTSSPSMIPIRTAPIGPRNGSGETVSAAETRVDARGCRAR